MRIGVKQEFWRAAGNGKLMRGLLFPENRPAGARVCGVVSELVGAFDDLLELIRAMDARVDGLR